MNKLSGVNVTNGTFRHEMELKHNKQEHNLWKLSTTRLYFHIHPSLRQYNLLFYITLITETNSFSETNSYKLNWKTWILNEFTYSLRHPK